MDSNIMKFLEEDEDETMHSGADVEAFTAELNRNIEGNASTLQQQPSDAEAAALSQGISQTVSHFLPQWQTSGHDDITDFQEGQGLMVSEEKEQNPSQLEPQNQGSDFENRKEENNSSHELTNLALPQEQDGQNTFPISQTMDAQTLGEQPLNIQDPDQEPNRERESQMHNLENTTNNQSVAMTSNNQKAVAAELSDQQSLATMNQHTTGMAMSSQQALTSGMSNQPSMTSNNQQLGTTMKLNKQVPFGMLLPIIQPQLDKDRAMQLNTLYLKLKKNEISKEGFVRHMRSLVGDQMLKMAVYKLQTQAARNSQKASNQFQSQPLASIRQLQVPSGAQMQSEQSNSMSNNDTLKSRDQADGQGVQVSQISTSSSSTLSQERKHPVIPAQGLNKQQHMPFPQASFPTYGTAGSSYPPFSATNVASPTSVRPHLHESQMRHAATHQNMSVNHLGPTSQAMNMLNMSKFDRPHSFGDPKKIQAGNLTQLNSNTTQQQNQVQWPSSTSNEQNIGGSSSMTCVKQEPDQLNEQHKAQLSSAQGLNPMSSAPFKQGNAASNLKDDSFEMQSSKTGLTPSTSLSNSRMSLTTPIGSGIISKATPKKPLIGQKKPMEAPGSSPPSSKKQKVAGAFLDQSIEQLNDVTAVSGVNLREEEEQLFSGPKEDSRVTEASRRVVQEEEERLILNKIPLQKKVVEIMAKCGLKSMSNDVERCMSLCVEERMRGLIANLIRLSKQRVDIEKPRHRTVVTSDVRQQIMKINSKAREEWERKQAETEKSQKQNEPEASIGVDGDKEKDESRTKSAKANKEEDDKMRATAANVAVRAATGVGDMLSRWQLMIEAKQKQGGTDSTSSVSQSSKDLARKALPTSTRSTKENQEAERRDSSAGFNTSASVRKVGRNQVIVPRVARSISVKDVIAILEREPQMSKSTLIYRLYDKIRTDAASE